ncbi:GntR family transcriptional regulator [Pseudonocardia sp. CA-107938]|uniref:GntR family transcriptional regulator n=1 Tax=Pseudonocardia sp. CA-107938 TaxID=3240021 RepID=UPI003D8B31BE
MRSEAFTGVPQFDTAPLAERVRAAILEAILGEKFVQRLPNEDVLAGMYGVSRTTIRAALQSLESDGVVTRRRAIGTTINSHVRRSALALQRLVSFAELLEERGHEVRVEAAHYRADAPPDDLLAAFGSDLAAGAPAFVTDTSFFADGRLAIWIRDLVPWSRLRDQSRVPEVGDPAHFDFARPYLVQPVVHAVAEIRPVVNDGERTPLPVAVGTAFTRLLERHYAADGTIMAVSLVDVDDDFVVFEVVRRG